MTIPKTMKCGVPKCKGDAVAFDTRSERAVCEKHAPWLADLVAGRVPRPEPISPCCGLGLVETITTAGLHYRMCIGCQMSWEVIA